MRFGQTFLPPRSSRYNIAAEGGVGMLGIGESYEAIEWEAEGEIHGEGERGEGEVLQFLTDLADPQARSQADFAELALARLRWKSWLA